MAVIKLDSQGFDYDKIDWNDHWDAAVDDDEQDRYFDEEEESEMLPSGAGTCGEPDVDMS